jgi:hypothetical protein
VKRKSEQKRNCKNVVRSLVNTCHGTFENKPCLALIADDHAKYKFG